MKDSHDCLDGCGKILLATPFDSSPDENGFKMNISSFACFASFLVTELVLSNADSIVDVKTNASKLSTWNRNQLLSKILLGIQCQLELLKQPTILN